MSHFFVVAILPKDTPADQTEDVVEKLMAQYSEELAVPEYEQDCYCVGREAKDRARTATKAEVGEFQSPVTSGRNFFDFTKEETRLHDDAYAVYEASYDEVAARILSADPDALKPNPDCEECGGSGKVKRTYNPLSKWDWYVVGGRWDGAIQNNRHKSADGGFNFGDEHRQLDRNTRAVAELGTEKDPPFAIVTPDGSWHERGKMGWFGSTHGNRTHGDWETEARGIFAQYTDHVAVGLDCHI